MPNRWNIPIWMEKSVLARDTTCVYCRQPFSGKDSDRKRRRSWEHIINDASMITLENIALCCTGCNASKGAKTVSSWLASSYCQVRGISETTVATVVREAIAKAEKPDLLRK